MATKTSFTRWIAGATLAAVGLWNVSAAAAAPPPPPVPAALTQQGRILDKAGAPVSSKVHFVFTIYDDPKAAKAANVLWTEEQDITLEDGYFSTELGSVTELTADVFNGSVRYLGVTVGSDDEMAPRQSITSVPYALLAGSAAVAALAETAPFTGLSGIPAPCAAGQYLKGYSPAGVPTCGTLPALSCTVPSTLATNATSATQGCAAGEVMTGGGCYSNGYLQASYQNVCISNLIVIGAASASTAAVGGPVIGICQAGTGTGLWTCNTSAASTIRAYAHCCKVQ